MASSSIHGVLNALTKKLLGVQNYSTWADIMQNVITLDKLWGYNTDKITKSIETKAQNVKNTYQENLNNALAIINLDVITTIRTNIKKSTTPKGRLGHIDKFLKKVRNQLEGVGQTVANKEMVMATLINLPRERSTNLGPFITNLCTQGRERPIPFSEFKGLLLQEESLRNARTSKGDSSKAYAIKHQGKAPMQKKSGGQGGQQQCGQQYGHQHG
eukprot:Gb_29337 [translate_table: standard]